MHHRGGKPIALKRLNVSRVAYFSSSDFPIIVTMKTGLDNAALRGCFGMWTLIKGAGRLFISAFSIDFGPAMRPRILQDIMAPHALTDLHDISGYYPSTIHQSLSPASAHPKSPKPSLPERVPHAKPPLGSRGFGSESPKNVWTLSADEVSEVEKNVRSFLSMSNTSSLAYVSEFQPGLDLPLNAINQTTFPLTSAFTSKLRAIVRTVYGEEKYFVLSGLDPYRYSDYQNVIIHAGLSSHVGSKRGMAGRTGGKNAVIRESICQDSEFTL